MMKHLLITLIAGFICSLTVSAKWHNDSQFNFKINVPDNWAVNSYTEGTDKVYDFTSPDENVAIQLRAFSAEGGITAELIADVYHEGLMEQGASKLSVMDDELNGLPGKLSVYKNNYDGQEVALVIFAAVKNEVGYSFLVVVPTAMFDQKMNETDAILNTFTVLERENPVVQKEEKPKGLGGLSSSSSANIPGKGSSVNNERIGLQLPEGKRWADGHWPDGKYDCGKSYFLGIVGFNDSHITWTGDNYIFRANNYMPEGSATWDATLVCPNYEDYCRIKLEHRWTQDNVEFVIQTNLPTHPNDKDRVHMDVSTSWTGWIDTWCIKTD